MGTSCRWTSVLFIRNAPRCLGLLGLLCLLPVMRPETAAAATIAVDTTDDELNSDGDCSLREAVSAANGDTAFDACTPGSGDDVIQLPAGAYTLTIPGSGEDSAATGDLDLTSGMTIVGAGASSTTITAIISDRIFHAIGAIMVQISGVTIQSGDSGSVHGGGIYNVQATLTLTDSVVRNNHSGDDGGGIANRQGGTIIVDGCSIKNNSASVQGGGIHNGATLIVTSSTVTGNTAGYAGGGIAHDIADSTAIADSTISGNSETTGSLGGGGLFFDTGGTGSVTRCTVTGNDAVNGGGISNFITLALTDSTVSNNSSSIWGGGVFNIGTVRMTNSTISGNRAGTGVAADGGGLFHQTGGLGTAYLNNVTMTGNSATGQGGGIANDAGLSVFGDVITQNSIIAGNTDSGDGGVPSDCSGPITSHGYNLLGSTAACTFSSATGDVVGQSSVLGTLADNGGPTKTHALLGGSPALDAGNPGGCADDLGSALSADQRGETRPFGSACDIGAVEIDPSSVTTSTTVMVTTTTTATAGGPGATTTTLPVNSICPDGGALGGGSILVKKLGGRARDEKLIFKGVLVFSGAVPGGLGPVTRGLQIIIEDLGAGAAAVFDLSARTNAIPAGGPGTGCGAKDGWKKLSYKNKSNALGVPTCVAGSANGLKKIRLKDKRKKGGGISFSVKTKKSSIATPVGPLRATVVLGATEADAAAGACGSSTFNCITDARGKTMRCASQ